MIHRAPTLTRSFHRRARDPSTQRARKALLTVCSAALGSVGALAAWAAPAGASTATVDVATTASFGTILANAQGFALYTLPTDHNGVSTCGAGCAPIWPALTVPSGTTPTAGPGVPGTVSATTQPNGTDQVTYNGSPLYTYIGDTAPGQVSGNGLQGFAVAKVTVAAPTPTSTPTSAPVPSSTPTSAPSSSPSPTTAPTQAASPSRASASSPTPAPATPSTPSASVPSSTSSLAFTGAGTGLFWTAMVGGALLTLSLAIFAFAAASDRRRNGGAVRTG
jgi:predicted lipoprotein with Yx(FWY)xxD motif